MQGKDNEFLSDPFGRRQSTWLVAQNFGSEGKIYWDRGLLANRGFNGQTTFHHTNYLGTERTRTNYQGLTSAMETSGPFGENLNEQNNGNLGNAAEDNSQYTGQEHDPESNTEHFQYRQYTSKLGHWMSPDPSSGSLHLGNPQSFNRYAYVLNNPLFYTDPDGTTEDGPCSEEVDCFVGEAPSTDGAGQQSSQAPSTSDSVNVTTPAPLTPTEIFRHTTDISHMHKATGFILPGYLTIRLVQERQAASPATPYFRTERRLEVMSLLHAII